MASGVAATAYGPFMDSGLWQEIGATITRGQGSDGREAARERFDQLWASCPPGEHALRCVIAHYAADLQDDASVELRWDELALAEHAASDAADWQVIGIADPEGMLASLHLNLGDGYLRAGRTGLAQQHLDAAEDGLAGLDDDGYGAMIRAGVEGLRERLAVAAER